MRFNVYISEKYESCIIIPTIIKSDKWYFREILLAAKLLIKLFKLPDFAGYEFLWST